MTNRFRRQFLRAVVAFAVVGSASLCAANNKPNVLLLLADDQRHDTMAALFGESDRMANLDVDRMVAECLQPGYHGCFLAYCRCGREMP